MKKILVISLLLLIITYTPASAHKGRTDANGGHTDNRTGEYHYHHGYPEHDHDGGLCQFNFDNKINTSINNDTANSNTVNQASTKSWDIFNYIGINIIAIIVYFTYLYIKIENFRKTFLNRLERGPKTIHPLIYYSFIILKFISTVILAILLFPTTIVIFIVRYYTFKNAINCFDAHRPDKHANDTISRMYAAHDGQHKKLRFYCDYWDSFNRATEPKKKCFRFNKSKTPINPYVCQNFCPIFKDEGNKYTYTPNDDITISKIRNSSS